MSFRLEGKYRITHDDPNDIGVYADIVVGMDDQDEHSMLDIVCDFRSVGDGENVFVSMSKQQARDLGKALHELLSAADEQEYADSLKVEEREQTVCGEYRSESDSRLGVDPCILFRGHDTRHVDAEGARWGAVNVDRDNDGWSD